MKYIGKKGSYIPAVILGSTSLKGEVGLSGHTLDTWFLVEAEQIRLAGLALPVAGLANGSQSWDRLRVAQAMTLVYTTSSGSGSSSSSSGGGGVGVGVGHKVICADMADSRWWMNYWCAGTAAGKYFTPYDRVQKVW